MLGNRQPATDVFGEFGGSCYHYYSLLGEYLMKMEQLERFDDAMVMVMVVMLMVGYIQ